MSINSKATHVKIGILMIVPLLLWAATGVVFLIKPGYENAYARLTPKLYKIEQAIPFSGEGEWREVRLVRTILGYHFIVFDGDNWKNFDALTQKEKQLPTSMDVENLIADAISSNLERYGNIVAVQGNSVTTDTNVKITLNWHALTLAQEGGDTRFISTLYKIHYLQWFGTASVDKLFGALAIFFLFSLTIFGVVSYATGKHSGRG